MNNVFTQEKELGNIGSSLDYFMKFNIQKSAKILDIGCNYGSLIYNLYKKGYRNVYGVDINNTSIEKGVNCYNEIKRRLFAYDGNILPFPEKEFDVVLMFDVIEHIPNIRDFLKNQVNRIIRGNGVLIFQTPNKPINIIWVYIDNHSFLVKWWEEHCSLQTYWSLKRILKNSNFLDIKLEKYNIYTKHNVNKIKKKAGHLGIFLLKAISKMPLVLYPNFYGSCVKNEKSSNYNC